MSSSACVTRWVASSVVSAARVRGRRARAKAASPQGDGGREEAPGREEVSTCEQAEAGGRGGAARSDAREDPRGAQGRPEDGRGDRRGDRDRAGEREHDAEQARQVRRRRQGRTRLQAARLASRRERPAVAPRSRASTIRPARQARHRRDGQRTQLRPQAPDARATSGDAVTGWRSDRANRRRVRQGEPRSPHAHPRSRPREMRAWPESSQPTRSPSATELCSRSSNSAARGPGRRRCRSIVLIVMREVSPQPRSATPSATSPTGRSSSGARTRTVSIALKR